MNKKYILYIILYYLLITNITNAQLLPDPITTSTEEFGDVTSDYGPRNTLTPGASIFHYGIDYDLDRGDPAYSVEIGVIYEFGAWIENYAYIKAGNWRYMHVETQYTDNYTWEYVENVFTDIYGQDFDNDDFIFLRDYHGNNNWDLIAVIGTNQYIGSCNLVYDDKSDSWTELKQSVESGDWIFTPRDYGASGVSGDHLHLGYAPNTSNPFEFVAHEDDGPPALPHIAVKKDQSGIAVPFEANVFEYTIIYGNKAILEGKAVSTGDKDIDKLSVGCKFSESDINFKKHWKYSKTEHGNQNCVDKVIKLDEVSNHDTYLNDTREGIFPYLEAVSIDYFKFHWNTTENEIAIFEKAYVNENAVYPDGIYDIEFKATDILGAENPQSTQAVLDNHQPYVKRVDIINDEKIYSSSIQYTQPNPPWDLFHLVRQVDQSNQNKFGVYDYDIEFIVEMSEAMHNVHLEIENTTWSNELQQVSDDARTWSGTISANQLQNIFPPQQSLIEYPLRISGVDKTQEHIVLDLNIPDDDDHLVVNALPYRNDNGEWENENVLGLIDKDHTLSFCGDCNFIRAVFDAQRQDGNRDDMLFDDFTDLYGHSPLTISFIDLSAGEPDSWIWDFGDMQGATNEQNPEHTFYNSTNEPVQFNVCLKVNKADDFDLTIKNKLITVYPAGYNITPIPDFDFEQITNSSPYRIDFYNYSSGPIQEFIWNFGDGNTNNTDFEPLHFYEHPGTYDITLTLNPGYADEEYIVKTIHIAESSGINSELDFSWYCSEADDPYNGEGILGSLITFDSEVANPDAIIFDWDMGDGVKMNLEDPWHTYASSGVFVVTLKIFDFYGDLIGQKTKTIQVIQNTQVIQPAGNEITFDNLISDIELPDDEDILFIAEGSLVHVYNFNIDNTPHPWVEDLSQLIDIEHDITNIAASGDNLLVGCAYEDDLKGRVHCFSKVNGVWQEQQVILDPDYNQGWFWRFGHYLALDQDHLIISAYNEQGKKHKITLWQYEPSSTQWQYIDFFYTQENLPAPPKIEIHSDVIIINSDVYTFQGDNWVKVNDDLPYNDFYIDRGVSTITMDGNIMMTTQQCIENSYAHLYKIDNNQAVYMNTLFSPGISNYAYSVSKRNNYIITGNKGKNYDCDYSLTQTNGSAILFRSNDFDYYYRYRTFTPENGIEGDLFGKKVEMNKHHIIVYSQGRNDDYYDKDPSFYYYYDYMYLCDKTLYLNSKKDLDNNKRGDFPINARIIEVAGSRDLCLNSSENVSMVGQTITLKPGFSVVNGGTLLASGIHCTDCYLQDDSGKSFYLKSVPVQDINLSEDIETVDEIFSVFPNPAMGFVIVKALTPASRILNIKVLTMQGVVFYNMSFNGGIKEYKIDIANFKPGHYVLQVEGEKGVSSNKLVKL